MSRDFWTRRREAVAAEIEAAEVATAEAELIHQEQTLESRSDAEVLAELDLPEPETLDSAEAIRNFLSHTLPQRLKARALRRLWGLNPVLANLDGLLEYGEDYTDSATVIENLQTAYQVGKGMLAHLEAQAEAAARAANADETETEDTAEAEEDAPSLDGDDGATIGGGREETAPPITEAATAPARAFEPDEVPEERPASRRRMTFAFET